MYVFPYAERRKMRPIDANALYDHLSSFTGMFTDEIGFAVNLNQVLDCIDVAPTIEQPQWISVEERLPELYMNDCGCICTPHNVVFGCEIHKAVFVGYCIKRVTIKAKTGEVFDSYLWYDTTGDRIEDVSHWMPLPKLPKGVE